MHSGNELVEHLLREFDSDEQKLKYLPRFADGRAVGSVALINPGPGINTGGIQIGATFRTEDFSWVLNGKSCHAIDAEEASVVVVFANVDWDDAREHKRSHLDPKEEHQAANNIHVPLGRRDVGPTAFVVGIATGAGTGVVSGTNGILCTSANIATRQNDNMARNRMTSVCNSSMPPPAVC